MSAVEGRMTRSQLESWVEGSLRESPYSVLRLPPPVQKPFRYLVSTNDVESPQILRIYAWRVTHGGGMARADDEFRIQLTGQRPNLVDGELTSIIGWSEQFEVFVGWDSKFHQNRFTSSPSLQVREETIRRAQRSGLAAAHRHSGDVVVAFRRELLAAYCLNAPDIHEDPDGDVVERLNYLSSTPVENRPPEQESRKKVTRTVELNYRAWDFGRRVRAAYGGVCGLCGLGLKLGEGAHIVPVAWEGSTDETKNGIYMCRIHHSAYDRQLLAVDSTYRVRVNWDLAETLLVDESEYSRKWLVEVDGHQLKHLPQDKKDWPDEKYLHEGMLARGWDV